MDQLVFERREKKPSAGATHIRVGRRQYEKIKELSIITDHSVYDMANELLDFALNNVVIKEEQ